MDDNDDDDDDDDVEVEEIGRYHQPRTVSRTR